jgi:hypothetical protein
MTTSIADWLDSQRFAEWMGHGVSTDLVARMSGNERVLARCIDLLDDRLGPFVPSRRQAIALSLDRSGLATLAHQAGVIWHAATIARLIDGAAVRNLVAAIGPELRLLAIRNVALAPPMEQTPSADIRLEMIHLAGQCCLAAWCAKQPSAIGKRIALRLPDRAEPEDAHHAFGPPIIDCLLIGHDEATT